MSLAIPSALDRPQTRARQPDADGFVSRDGVRIFWERFADGEPAVLLLPTWSIVHSRFWKAQVPYLARHFRVLTFDGRGNGRSDRPVRSEAYTTDQFALDALGVMDAAGADSAVLVAFSCGALWATIVAAEHPERVRGVVYISPAVGLERPHPERDVWRFEEPLPADDGWAKYNRHYWARDYQGFVEFFFGRCFTEPHSSKQIEDCVVWALQTTPQVLIDIEHGQDLPRREPFAQTCARVRCPVLVIHGDSDAVRPIAEGKALARATGGEFVALPGSGHAPVARDPVRVNLLLHDFIAASARG